MTVVPWRAAIKQPRLVLRWVKGRTFCEKRSKRMVACVQLQLNRFLYLAPTVDQVLKPRELADLKGTGLRTM